MFGLQQPNLRVRTALSVLVWLVRASVNPFARIGLFVQDVVEHLDDSLLDLFGDRRDNASGTVLRFR